MKLKNSNTLVPVFIPKENKNDDALFVAVNGKRMLIKKGESVMLPVPFAEAVENSFAAKREAESFIESVSKE
ncbi:MAG: hypothetical protein SOX69_09050 [Oscillospiraceae bacterium]|nr:hypothetical protein [Oscillospiraceae bacterium]